jgi:hypothetical protein
MTYTKYFLYHRVTEQTDECTFSENGEALSELEALRRINRWNQQCPEQWAYWI